MVLIMDKRYSPTKWPLGRIIKTHPGEDGHVRRYNSHSGFHPEETDSEDLPTSHPN